MAITNDAVFEGQKTSKSPFTPSNATLGTSTVLTSIIDDEGAPTISIDDVSVNESAGTMTFMVSVSRVTASAVTFNYATSNGTATAGSDYVAIGSSAAGSIACGNDVDDDHGQYNNDYFKEGRNFNVTLSNVSSNVDIAGRFGRCRYDQ